MNDTHEFFHNIMLRHFHAATTQYEKQHKSAFWDVYDESWQNLIHNVELWPSFRRSGLTSGMETGLMMADRKSLIEQGQLIPEEYPEAKQQEEARRRFEDLQKMMGTQFIIDNLECEIGSPIHAKHQDLKLNLDELFHLYHAWQLWRFSRQHKKPDCIVEIGGGYGNLAAKLFKLFQPSKMILLDLPEANLLQMYYLHTRFPDAKILGVADLGNNPQETLRTENYDIAILPGWLADAIPAQSVGLAVNTRSLMEMRSQTIAFYLENIQRMVRVSGVFYCVNRYVKQIGTERIALKHYPFDDNWEFVLSQPTWKQAHLHELIAIRTNSPPRFPPSFLLQSLPEESPPPMTSNYYRA